MKKQPKYAFLVSKKRNWLQKILRLRVRPEWKVFDGTTWTTTKDYKPPSGGNEWGWGDPDKTE